MTNDRTEKRLAIPQSRLVPCPFTGFPSRNRRHSTRLDASPSGARTRLKQKSLRFPASFRCVARQPPEDGEGGTRKTVQPCESHHPETRDKGARKRTGRPRTPNVASFTEYYKYLNNSFRLIFPVTLTLANRKYMPIISNIFRIQFRRRNGLANVLPAKPDFKYGRFVLSLGR